MKNKVINLFDKLQDEETKYSKLVAQFIKPFVNDVTDTEEYKEIVELGIKAWNIANVKIIIPIGEVEDAIHSFKDEEIDIDLLNKMVTYKMDHFKAYTHFIVDYQLKETASIPVLSVVTEAEDDFLSSLTEILEADQNEENFEENYIDRVAIILKPKQPFIDWLTNLYPDEVINMSNLSTYLIDEDVEVEAWLQKKFDKLFTMELEGWHTNKKDWPQKRNYQLFKQWFQIEISPMVYDLEKHPVSKF